MMNGTGAMLVYGGAHHLEGCTERESRLCEAFADCLVSCASSVIAELRPAALFTFRLTAKSRISMSYSEFRELARTYRSELQRRGITLELLGAQRHGRVTLLIYRPQLIDKLLGCSETRSFLEHQGYDSSDALRLMHQFAARLAWFYTTLEQGESVSDFPHEIGLLFGYPLEDVIGFMSGARETCHGLWRSYGDQKTAQRRFATIRNAEKDRIERYRAGLPLYELFPLS
jgi:hypothetical protein